MKKLFAGALVAVLVFSIQACSTTAPTTLKGEWASPEYRKIPVHHVLVVAASADEWVRGAFETTLKEEFEKRGVRVTSAYQAMPDKVKFSKDVFEKYFKDQDIDAVVISQLLNVDTEAETTEGSYTQRTPIQLESTFYGYSGYVFDRQYYPGMATNTEVIRVETRLYETKEAKLMWRALSKTSNPKNAMDIMHSLTKAIVDTLAHNGVLGTK